MCFYVNFIHLHKNVHGVTSHSTVTLNVVPLSIYRIESRHPIIVYFLTYLKKIIHHYSHVAKCLKKRKFHFYSWRSLERPDPFWDPHTSVQGVPGCPFPRVNLTTPFHISAERKKKWCYNFSHSKCFETWRIKICQGNCVAFIRVERFRDSLFLSNRKE